MLNYLFFIWSCYMPLTVDAYAIVPYNPHYDNTIYFANICAYFLFVICYTYFHKHTNKHLHKLSEQSSIILNMYKLSCFNYTIVGLFLLKYPLRTPYFQVFFPHNMILQGIISYLSDVVYFDACHWSHQLDVTFATYNTIIGIVLFYKHNLTTYEQIIILFGVLVQK